MSYSFENIRIKSARITTILVALVVASWTGNLVFTQNWLVLFKHDGPQVRVVKVSDQDAQWIDHHHPYEHSHGFNHSDHPSDDHDDEKDELWASSRNTTGDRSSSGTSKFETKGGKRPSLETSSYLRGIEQSYSSTKSQNQSSSPILQTQQPTEAPLPGRTVTRMHENETYWGSLSTEGTLDGDVLQRSRNETMPTKNAKNDTRKEAPFEDELLKAWRAFDQENVSLKQQSMVNIVQNSDSERPQVDVSLATFAKTSKLVHLLNMLSRWSGPIEVAVYIASEDDVHRLGTFYQRHKEKLERVGFHVLMEKQMTDMEQKYLPEGALRNLAAEQVSTDFLIVLDVEFISSANCYKTITKMLRTNPRVTAFLRDHHLMVLPTFESRVDKESIDTAPSNKTDVIERRANHTLEFIPMPLLAEGVYPTMFGMWSRDGAGDMFPTNYAFGYEPVVLASKDVLPRYQPHFRGQWYSQLALFEEANVIGYELGVLRHAFVFRMERRRTIEADPVETNKFQNYHKMIRQLYDYTNIVNTVHELDQRDISSCPILPEKGGDWSDAKVRILCEWQNFTESKHLRRQIVSVVHPQKSESSHCDITLATQGSVDRLDRLIDGVSRWSGPVSAAIYVTHEKALEDFFDFYKENRVALNETTFHFFFEKVINPRDKQYRKYS